MKNFNTAQGPPTEKKEIIHKTEMSEFSFLASPMVIKRCTRLSIFLNILSNEHGQRIHNDGKEIGGERVTLSESPCCAKEANKFTIYIDGVLGRSDAGANPSNKSRWETQLR